MTVWSKALLHSLTTILKLFHTWAPLTRGGMTICELCLDGMCCPPRTKGGGITVPALRPVTCEHNNDSTILPSSYKTSDLDLNIHFGCSIPYPNTNHCVNKMRKMNSYLRGPFAWVHASSDQRRRSSHRATRLNNKQTRTLEHLQSSNNWHLHLWAKIKHNKESALLYFYLLYCALLLDLALSQFLEQY